MPSLQIFASQVQSDDISSYRTVDAETHDGVVAAALMTTSIYEGKDTNTTVLGFVLTNQIIRVLETDNGFSKIRYGSSYGYVVTDDLVTNDDLITHIINNPNWYTQTIVVTTDEATVYDWITGKPFKVVHAGDSFQLRDVSNAYYVGIYTVINSKGEEENSLINIQKQDAKLTYDLHVTSFADVHYSNFSQQRNIVDYACSLVGYPYVWGGNDPYTGVDCSGFVKYVYAKYGYTLPRCSWEQATVGKEVSFDELEPGDLIFYNRGERIGHVTMYIGDGLCVQARGKDYNICITPYDYSPPLKAMRILER